MRKLLMAAFCCAAVPLAACASSQTPKPAVDTTTVTSAPTTARSSAPATRTTSPSGSAPVVAGYWDSNGNPVNGGPPGANGSTGNNLTRGYCAQHQDPGCPAGSYVGPNAIPNPNGDNNYVPCEGTVCTNPNHGGNTETAAPPPEPGQTTFQPGPNAAPPEPGENSYESPSVVDAPPEPGQTTFQPGTNDAPPEPGQTTFQSPSANNAPPEPGQTTFQSGSASGPS